MALRDNMRLYDIATRKQIYVEGVKAQFASEFNDVMNELRIELRRLLVRIKYKNLDGMTKAELNAFMIALRKSQSKVYSAYTQKVIDQLKAFMQADLELTRRIFATAAKEIDEEVEDDEEVEPLDDDEAIEYIKEKNTALLLIPLFGIAAVTGNPDKLWSSIRNNPIPANGMYLDAFIKTFAVSAQSGVENLIRQAYANGESVSAVIDVLLDDKARQGQSSQIQRIGNQARSVLNTTIQFIAQSVSAGVTSSLYGRYRWYSVMDGRTTDICISRNLKEYRYGAGPLPPAHIGCRSHIAPIVGNEPTPQETFYQWVARQPDAVQDDILGASQAKTVRSGETKAKDLPKFQNTKVLTNDQYRNSVKDILTR